MNRSARRSRRQIPTAELDALAELANWVGWPTSTLGWSVSLHDDHGRHCLVALHPRLNRLKEATARRLLAATALHAMLHLDAPLGPDLRRGSGPDGTPLLAIKIEGNMVNLVGHGAGTMLGPLIRNLEFEPECRPTRGLHGAAYRAVPTVTQLRGVA